MTYDATTLEHVTPPMGRWSQLWDAGDNPAPTPFLNPLPKSAAAARTATTNNYIAASGLAGQLAPHFEKIDALPTNPTLWPRGVDGPTPSALAIAKAVLAQIDEGTASPTRVVASAEGGVAICFVRGDKYADIECLNSGVILGVTTNRRDLPTAWELDESPASFAKALEKITKFFEQSAGQNVHGRARS